LYKMALINQNSIIGLTSITSPSASNVLTVHTNDTTERLRVSTSGLSFSGTNASLDTSGNATFNGNVSIGGTLTYEDVTNIDSVGIVTARAGINISGGDLKVGGTNVINSGRVLYNVEQIKLADTKELVLGSSNDFKIYHSGSHSFISEEGAGALKIKGDDIRFENAGAIERLRITSAGLVGIGTDNPVLKTHIYNTANADVALIESTQNFATIRFKSATNTSGPTIGIDGAGGLQLDQKDTSKYIAFAIGSERLRITSGGNVNIGGDYTQTDSKVTILDASKPIAEATLNLQSSTTSGAADTGPVLRFYGHSGSEGRYHASIKGAKENGTSGNTAGYLALNTRPAGGAMAERVRITSAGKIGINNTDPAYQLSINGTGAVRNEIVCTDNNGAGAGVYFRTMNGGSMVSNATIRTDNSGNLQFFIGTSSDVERLRITSEGLVAMPASSVAANNANRGYYHGVGTAQSVGMTMKTLGYGSGTGGFDTAVSVNAGNAGAVALLFATRNTSNGTSTNGGIYVAHFYYDGNNLPAVTFLGGSNWVTWSKSAGNTLQANWSGNSNYTFSMMMCQ
jgi:hypothetical protein